MKVSDRFPTHAKDPAFGPTIWVTRTSPDNEKTAGALRRLGFDALAVPVLRVEGLPEKALDEPPDAIVFTSVNGVRHHSICPALLDIPVFAVGDRTAASAAHAGYTHVVSAAGDVLDLERLIVQSLPRGSRLLHFSAHRPAGDLTGNLRRKGYLATRKPVYETRDVAVAKLLASLPAPHEINGILIHSPRAGHVVKRCLERTSRPFRGIVYCISDAAAAPFEGKQGMDIRVAARPDEASMLALIGNPNGTQEQPHPLA